jgi:glycerol-3-phosphate acyltransferase PlsY
MTDAVLGPLLVVLGYLSGSVPYGYVLPKLVKGVDVRTIGSGNIGATNAARAGGRTLGVVVFILDVAKAMVPVVVAQWLFEGRPQGDLWIMGTAIAAFAGHLFPVWLGFKGGKGVATGLGVFSVLATGPALAGFAAWILIYLTVRISSVGSLVGTLVCAVGTFWLRGAGSPIAWAAGALAALIWWRHRENIGRLLRGEEKPKPRKAKGGADAG